MKYLDKYRNLHLKQIYVLLMFSAVWLTGCNHWHVPLENPSLDTTASELEIPEDSNAQPNATAAVEIEEPAGPLTLRDALSLTLLNNPELKAFTYSIRVAEARHLQVGLWPNPELSVDVEDVGGSGAFSGFDAAQTTIQLSQLFDLSGKDEKLQKVAYYDVHLTKQDYQMKRLDVSMAVTQSFIELLFLQEKQQLSSRLIEVSEAVIQSVEKRIQAGKDTPLDLLKAEVGREKAIMYHNEIKKQIESIRVQLASYWSGKNPKFTVAAGDLGQIDAVPDIAELQDLLQHNPDVAQWAFEIQKRQAQIQFAKAESVPDLILGGGIRHFNFDDETAFVFSLSMPLPITNRNQGRRLEAINSLKEAKLKEQAIYQNVWTQLHHFHNQLQSAYSKATLLENKVLPASEKIFNASNKSYQEGKIGYLELLDAQRSYFAAKDEYIDALAQYHVVKTELERLLGQSLELNEVSNESIMNQ